MLIKLDELTDIVEKAVEGLTVPLPSFVGTLMGDWVERLREQSGGAMEFEPALLREVFICPTPSMQRVIDILPDIPGLKESAQELADFGAAWAKNIHAAITAEEVANE